MSSSALINTEVLPALNLVSEQKTSSNEFNRENIIALGNLVNLVDSDEEEGLDMFCYVKCDDSDSSLLKQCRGVVFHKNDLVLKAFPFTTEYNHTEFEKINDSLSKFEDWTFYESHEGALIRLFSFNGKRFVSTHRKLNAFRSKWSSKDSFGSSFKTALLSELEHNESFKQSLPDGENILDRFQTTLDPTKQYMFLVRNNNDNRIVCSSPIKPTVYHVGTFVEGKLVMTENVNIPHPKQLKFKNIDDLREYVQGVDYKHLQGVICFDSNNNQIKIVNVDYQDLFHARGNEPSVKFRYLQVRMNKKFVNMLHHLYPDMSNTFDEYENTIYDISRNIYRSYVQRFIKKRYVTVPREEFSIIRECHSWHLNDRTNNRISLDVVINTMNQQPPTNINHMIRRYRLEQARQKENENEGENVEEGPRSPIRSYEKTPENRKGLRPIRGRKNNVSRDPAPINVSPLLLPRNGEQSKPVQRILSVLPRPRLRGGKT